MSLSVIFTSSQELLNFLETINPSKQSIILDGSTNQLVAIEKRSSLRNFFSWFIYLITFTLVPRNRSLDAMTNRIFEIIGKEIRERREDLTHDEKNRFIHAIKILREINNNNGGNENAKIQKLLAKIEEVKSIATKAIFKKNVHKEKIHNHKNFVNAPADDREDKIHHSTHMQKSGKDEKSIKTMMESIEASTAHKRKEENVNPTKITDVKWEEQQQEKPVIFDAPADDKQLKEKKETFEISAILDQPSEIDLKEAKVEENLRRSSEAFVQQDLAATAVEKLQLPNISQEEEKEQVEATSNFVIETKEKEIQAPALVQSLPISPGLNFKKFGKEAWALYFGIVEEEPPLPDNIEAILQKACPIFKDKKIEDTHTLVLIPKTVDGIPFNLKSFENLLKKPGLGEAAKYREFCEHTAKDHGHTTIDKPYWILLSDVIPESRKKSYRDQCELIKKIASVSGIDYRVPKAIEVTVGAITKYVSETNENLKTRLYSDNPWTHIRCQEKSGGFQVIVGDFGPTGLLIGKNIHGDALDIGMALCYAFN